MWFLECTWLSFKKMYVIDWLASVKEGFQLQKTEGEGYMEGQDKWNYFITTHYHVLSLGSPA
jgi:hypothetical protein